MSKLEFSLCDLNITHHKSKVPGWFKHFFLARWNYNKHNPFTLNTSRKWTHSTTTYHKAVRHTTSSAVFLKQNFLVFFRTPKCLCISEFAESGCLWLGSHAYCLCFHAALCLKYNKAPRPYLKHTGSVKKKLNSLKLLFKKLSRKKCRW